MIKWTKSPHQDFTKDMRGWPQGKTRKHTKTEIKRIKEIHQELAKDKKEFFAGASAIIQKWLEEYPDIQPPYPKFIGRVLKAAGRTEKIQKGRNKGASRYLHYPEYSIGQIGESLLEIDFIGKKFIRGRTEPLNFIGFSLRKPCKLKHFRRITGETGSNVIKESKRFFKKFEKPDTVKMDNGFATYGGGQHKRLLTKAIIFYLKEQVIPIFAPPRKPWSQASIEGSNSVFSRKFWNKEDFENLPYLDERLRAFNKCYQWYLGYRPPKQRTKKENFIPKVYFIRKVYQNPEIEKGYIDVANEHISIPKFYINLFTLSEWNLKQEQLYIYFENEEKLELIKKLSFKLHSNSKEKLFN